MIKSKFALAITAATLAIVSTAAPASAGEVNGNGTGLPLAGASLCKYSGLNDALTPQEPTRTQSYGTFFVLIKGLAGIDAAKAALPSPGIACNPTSGFEE